MPTQVNFTIKKDGTGDYTSIKSFVVAEGKDLVTADENHSVTIHGAGWDSTTPLSETFIDFASYTTDVTRNVTFFVQTADRHNYTAGSGFVFTISTSFGFVFRSKHIVLDGFEIANTSNTSTLFDTSSNVILKNSLVHGVDSASFLGDGEFNLHYNYASRGGFANTFYNGGMLLNVTCIQLGSEGGFTGDIGIANASCTNVVLYTDKATGSFSNYYLCTGDYNAINKTGENVPGTNSIETVVAGDFVDFVAENYTSKLGGALEASGFAGTFIGGSLEVGGSAVTVATNTIDQTQSIEQVTLTQQSSITIGGLAQAQSIEQLTLQANGTLSLNNLEQIQSIEQVNLTQAHIISVNPIDQAQTLGQVSLLVAGTLSVNDTTQTQTLEQTILSVIASLAINDITQAQEVEQVIVTAFNGSAVSIASIDQAQNIGAVTLSQLNVVSVDNLSQSQLLQAVNFNGVVVGYLQGALTIISAYNGRIKLTNPLTGEIRIL